MSSRQKSFFDQDHGNKPKQRPQWHRTRSASDISKSTNRDTRAPVMTGPPIQASTPARTKLKAFQFIEGRPGDNYTDKENGGLEKNIDTHAGQKPETTVAGAVHPQVPTLEKSKTCPPATPTPATRLPLADLVGNADLAAKRGTAQATSPDEHIYWHVKSPGSSQVAATPARKRKRARSSSPPSSSQQEASNFGNQAPDEPATKFKTPQADPAADLWSRYAVHAANQDTPTGAKGTAFAHLMTDSSPRSSAEAGSVSGLRRWASCGLEWPTSKAKRRRTTGVFRGALEEVGEAGEDDESEMSAFTRPKISKVGSLVERIQETLAKPLRQRLPGEPSSSEPLLETGGYASASQASPLQRLAPVIEMGGVNSDSADPDQQTADVDAGTKLTPSPLSSSEFGDEDIDLDLLEAVQATSSTVQAKLYSIPGVAPEGLSMDSSKLKPQTPTPGAAGEMFVKQAISRSDDDEFGFGDEDEEFAAGLENVTSLYDKRSELSASPLPQQSLPKEKDNDHSIQKAHEHINLIESDDEFGGDDIDAEQFEAAEIAATQAMKNSGASSECDRNSRTIQRYLVTNVVEGEYMTEKGYMQPEKVLLVEDEKTKIAKAITLRQSWYETRCTPGSHVHIIGQFTRTGQCVVDNDHNMIILHPDHLISATTVGDSFGCMRKAVLQDRVKATSDANEYAMIGTILHEIFQEAMKANRWDHEWLIDLIKRLIPRKFETILEIGLTVEYVIDRLVNKLPELQAWAKIFVKATPGSDAVVKDRDGKTLQMSINKLLEVEEHIWSPTYGLKGNIDASVQVLMRDGFGERTLTAPFELKTGRSVHVSHQAQTALYTLLMSDRYDVDIAYGILFYLDSSEVSRIPAIRHEIRQMIIQRNELACYVRERLQLPPMLTNSYACNKCYAQETCFLYHRLADYGDGETLGGPAKKKFDELVRNLKPSHQDFFQKWDTLLTKEESEMKRFHRELWTMLSNEREKLGRCFANVVVEPDSMKERVDGEKINRFQYTLVKHNAPSGFSFTESQITVGEPIVISDEMGHFALANGYVMHVRKRAITVAVDRRLHNVRTRRPGFDSETNQSFVGLMDVTVDNVTSQKSRDHDEEPLLYRLDKDEFSNGMAMIRNNLIQLMNDGDFRSVVLRGLIVDGVAPIFKDSPSAYSVESQTSQMAMNTDQKAAVEKVFSAQDYALVLGMPGTGKTTTIAHIIRALVAKGKSVLLTSYTHTAVDNILLKIRNDGIGILRLGAVAKIHPEVQEFATLAAHPKDTLEELERSWIDPPVVATTCLTINHPIFRRRVFDYCIVDEASQITLPVCLGPIRMAKRFILVGDHFQLPPLVQNKEAQEGGLDVSLFKLLSERHPEAVVNLEHQYRMCADVMFLSNHLIYDGRLKCGNEEVADRSLSIPNIGALEKHHSFTQQSKSNCFNSSIPLCSNHTSPNCWLAHTLKPANKVVFLNTDLLLPTSLESVSGSRILNPLEASLTTQLVEALLSTGIGVLDIGVITFYRSQLALLRQSLRHRPGLELHTADKFQGRDKEIVLVSCVRSNEAQAVGELLKDWRRVNVALTRARSKLVILGSKKTLAGGNDTLRDLVAVCEEKGWVLDLQPGARDAHVFDEVATQTQGEGLTSPAATRTRTATAGVEQSRSKNESKSTPSPTKKKKNKEARGVLSPSTGKENRVAKAAGLGSPVKKGRVRKRAILGSRPVLRDIVNEALPGGAVD